MSEVTTAQDLARRIRLAALVSTGDSPKQVVIPRLVKPAVWREPDVLELVLRFPTHGTTHAHLTISLDGQVRFEFHEDYPPIIDTVEAVYLLRVIP